MKLGILKTGAPPESCQPRFGGYPDMFRALLGDGYDYETFAVDAGALPSGPEACDGWIITGSSVGVYDPEPWIADLLAFVRESRDAPMIGVCFGHQAMAQALGGQVVKSPKGWGVGVHEYALLIREPWMDAGPDRIRLAASHQDQVVARPPSAEVFAASTFTPFGGLAYRDRPAISIQLHPEFDAAYAIALIESRRGSRYTDEQADRAIASYDGGEDRARLGRWFGEFLSRVT